MYKTNDRPNDTTQPMPVYDIPALVGKPHLKGFIFYIRIRSAWLYIHIETQNFHRSPIALETAHMNTKRLHSDDDPPELWDYLVLLASHFLPEFKKIAPTVNHVGKLTLADLRARQFYKCHLEFYDEVPRPSLITPWAPDEEHVPSDQYSLVSTRPMSRLHIMTRAPSLI
jgi:hypothetical protein